MYMHTRPSPLPSSPCLPSLSGTAGVGCSSIRPYHAVVPPWAMAAPGRAGSHRLAGPRQIGRIESGRESVLVLSSPASVPRLRVGTARKSAHSDHFFPLGGPSQRPWAHVAFEASWVKRANAMFRAERGKTKPEPSPKCSPIPSLLAPSLLSNLSPTPIDHSITHCNVSDSP